MNPSSKVSDLKKKATNMHLCNLILWLILSLTALYLKLTESHHSHLLVYRQTNFGRKCWLKIHYFIMFVFHLLNFLSLKSVYWNTHSMYLSGCPQGHFAGQKQRTVFTYYQQKKSALRPKLKNFYYMSGHVVLNVIQCTPYCMN